jgi:hypothetical protein
MLKKALSLIALLSLITSPASAFDTYWHSQAVQKVGAEFGFGEDAGKIMQLGNFAPDLFGPVSAFASERLQGKELQVVQDYAAKHPQEQAAAVFLHFDNLNGELTRNAQFDYLFAQLLQSTQKLLTDFNSRPGLDDRTRKVLVLVTLGASLHAVQDFYSHSDWVHQDFNQTPVKMVPLPQGGSRAPTWFEFRAASADTDKWPFQVKTGIYPPANDAPNTHTHMNHDNSRLLYKEIENPGQPLRPQAKYHEAGPQPAHEQDEASIAAHQKLAVDTAIAASTEWVRKVEENAGAKAAIEHAKGWNLKTDNPKLLKELKAGLATQMALSCAAGRWDGEEPPADRGVLCKSVLERTPTAINPTSGSQIESEIIGLVTGVALPWAMKFTGKFWDVYPQYQVLQQLTSEISSGGGHYRVK